MSKAIIAGKEYEIPEITFEEICRLEENGIYLLNMDPKQRNVATILRGLVAWIMDVEPEQASEVIQEHIQNGGNIIDILDKVYEAIADAGFFGQNAGQEQSGQVTQIPNREQRRRNKRNRRRNTDPSQRS